MKKNSNKPKSFFFLLIFVLCFTSSQPLFAGGDGMFDNEQYFDPDDLPPEFDADDDPPPGAPVDQYLLISGFLIIGYSYYEFKKRKQLTS